MTLEEILALGPVIPVVVIDDPARAAPLARALLRGGMGVIEVTLRTPAALDAIDAIRTGVEEMIVGAGTVLDGAQLQACRHAGAHFAVSPGASTGLLAAQQANALPWLPGAATVTESMRLHDAGHGLQKFFPAATCGGVAWLRAVHSVLPAVRYCPTGGIDAGNASEYLQMANVAAVGGSWVAPAGAIAGGDFERIEHLAREAREVLGRPAGQRTT